MPKDNSKIYKFQVNKVLMTCSQNNISVYNLANGDINMVDNVFIYLLELFSKLDENKTNNYITKILIGIKEICEYYMEIEQSIDVELVTKIKSLEEKYNNLIEKTGAKSDENIIRIITEINYFIDQNYSNQDQSLISDLSEKVDKLTKEVSQNGKTIKQLSQQIIDQDRVIKKLNRDNQKLEKEYIKENNSLQEKIYEKDKQNECLYQQKNELEEQNRNLSLTLKDADSKIENLNETLKSILIRKTQDEVERERKKRREKDLDEYIILKLINNGYTLDQLSKELNSDDNTYSLGEIKESLARVKTRINIINPCKQSFPVEYKACSPLITKGGIFNINTNNNVYDVLLTSDWHIWNYHIENGTLIKELDKVYNYCTKNNINLVLNLGDLLHAVQHPEIKRYRDNLNVLDEMIEKMPYDASISHAVLGGNHDKYMLDIGFDPLKYLSDNREDFINLGYNDVYLTFNDENVKQIIGLHHPYESRTRINIEDTNAHAILNYLKEKKQQYNMRNRDIYIDFFGHFHTARIDSFNGYASIPPFIKGNEKNMNGVWHLKIYFDNENNIQYMIIKSLVGDEKLNPVMETVYQKNLK